MDYRRSPESPNRNLKKIELPKEIKTFFSKRGKFIRGLPSYEQVEGQFPNNHDEFFDFEYGFPLPLRESCAVNNLDSENYDRAQKHTKNLLSLFFQENEKEISAPERKYMLTGGTKPIRIASEIAGKDLRIYAKLPSVERIAGLSIYNIIAENEPINFMFSEYIFVEDSVKGRHLDHENLRFIQEIKNLPEKIIRLNLQDQFIGINDLNRNIDLPNKPGNLANILIQNTGHCVAFDVDCAFNWEFPPYNLVDLFRDRGISISSDLERRITSEEAQRISQKIHGKKKKPYQKILKLLGKIPSLNERFEEIGYKSAKEYFKSKESWLKSKF